MRKGSRPLLMSNCAQKRVKLGMREHPQPPPSLSCGVHTAVLLLIAARGGLGTQREAHRCARDLPTDAERGGLPPHSRGGLPEGRRGTARPARRRLYWLGMSAALSGETVKEVLDKDDNGKVSKQEYATLDKNRDGKVTKKEAGDIDRDGKAERRERDALDTNDDGKVSRHEVLDAPSADVDGDGRVTQKERERVLTSPPPLRSPAPSAAPLPQPPWIHACERTCHVKARRVHAPADAFASSEFPCSALLHLSCRRAAEVTSSLYCTEPDVCEGCCTNAPPPLPALPPRSSWEHGLWDTWEDAVDEGVLLLVSISTVVQIMRWVARRLARRRYQAVERRAAETWGPDPGLELAKAAEGGSADEVELHADVGLPVGDTSGRSAKQPPPEPAPQLISHPVE
jgi:hypothetical protein